MRLNLTPERSWDFVLSNKIKVMLGDVDIEHRLQRLVKLYPKIVGSKPEQVRRIDLRYANGLAVKWRSKHK